jgi:hypothetical protein
MIEKIQSFNVRSQFGNGGGPNYIIWHTPNQRMGFQKNIKESSAINFLAARSQYLDDSLFFPGTQLLLAEHNGLLLQLLYTVFLCACSRNPDRLANPGRNINSLPK